MAGNANPPVTIPMERGEVGVNHVMAKERLLFVTGRPVEPHSAKADCHFKRWLWPKLLKCMPAALGWRLVVNARVWRSRS